MLLFTLTWCGALGYLIDRHLEEELVKLQKHYKSEFSKNIASIVMNVLQIVFSACGVYGPADYQAAEKAPMWPAVRNDPQRVALLGGKLWMPGNALCLTLPFSDIQTRIF